MSPQSQGIEASYRSISPVSDDDNILERSRSSSRELSTRGHIVSQKEASEKLSTHLQRSSYVVFLVIFYACLAIFAWSVICVLSSRPITTLQYGWSIDAAVSHPSFSQNENWYNIARVIQAIVAVLTVPLTSAICSNAAVVYAQRCSNSFTVRQLITLADKGWTDPMTYTRIFGTRNGWKRHGSLFLVLAMLLNILGAVLAPLQQIFISSQTVKTPTNTVSLKPIQDIPDKFHFEVSYTTDLMGGLSTNLRRSLETSTLRDVQSLLWHQSKNISCVFSPDDVRYDDEIPELCSELGAMLNDISELEDPFLAQLPSQYHTGLIRQYAPRFNSTAAWTQISTAEFPQRCGADDGAYYMEYRNTTKLPYNQRSDRTVSWSLEACMPGDLRRSPWWETRKRQDISEELYLNITFQDDKSYREGDNTPHGGSLYRVTLDTTMGYFELPNYMNQQTAGPLLDDDPQSLCTVSNSCYSQFTNRKPAHPGDEETYKRQRYDSPTQVPTKGPLLTTAIALFGENSFLDNLLRNRNLYYNKNRPSLSDCLDLAPLGGLLPSDDDPDYPDHHTSVKSCIQIYDVDDIVTSVAVPWLQLFQYNTSVMTTVFKSAAFLANKAWMENNPDYDSLRVHYDLGADTSKPFVSPAGVAVVSSLLAVYILALFAMAMYAALYPRWTAFLDAFTMMRIGSAMHSDLSLEVVRDAGKVAVLDETPGRVGDCNGGEEVGRVGLGGGGYLKGSRLYECFDGDRKVD